MNDHLSGKELFIRFTALAFRKLLFIYVFSSFLVLRARYGILDHWLSFYFDVYLFIYKINPAIIVYSYADAQSFLWMHTCVVWMENWW